MQAELHQLKSSLKLVLRLWLVIQTSGVQTRDLFLVILLTLVVSTLDAERRASWDLLQGRCVFVIGIQLRDGHKLFFWKDLVEELEFLFVVRELQVEANLFVCSDVVLVKLLEETLQQGQVVGLDLQVSMDL